MYHFTTQPLSYVTLKKGEKSLRIEDLVSEIEADKNSGNLKAAITFVTDVPFSELKETASERTIAYMAQTLRSLKTLRALYDWNDQLEEELHHDH